MHARLIRSILLVWCGCTFIVGASVVFGKVAAPGNILTVEGFYRGTVLLQLIDTARGIIQPLTNLYATRNPTESMMRSAWLRAAWSANGADLAFVVGSNSTNRRICRTAFPSEQVHCLQTVALWDDSPTWSPDGEALSFESIHNRLGREIYRVTLADNRIQRLTNNPAEDSHHTWSPDGKRIAFISNRNDLFQLFVMQADGSQQGIIDVGDMAVIAPAWSPDGNSIAFVGFVSGVSEAEIFTVSPVCTALDTQCTPIIHQITHHQTTIDDVSWSPDGKRLAFISMRDGDLDIYIHDIATGLEYQLTQNEVVDQYPSWSLDGQAIAYLSNRTGDYAVFTQPVYNDAAATQWTYTTLALETPRWRPQPN
jgi:Tol biopolymer transport system component